MAKGYSKGVHNYLNENYSYDKMVSTSSGHFENINEIPGFNFYNARINNDDAIKALTTNKDAFYEACDTIADHLLQVDGKRLERDAETDPKAAEAWQEHNNVRSSISETLAAAYAAYIGVLCIKQNSKDDQNKTAFNTEYGKVIGKYCNRHHLSLDELLNMVLNSYDKDKLFITSEDDKYLPAASANANKFIDDYNKPHSDKKIVDVNEYMKTKTPEQSTIEDIMWEGQKRINDINYFYNKYYNPPPQPEQETPSGAFVPSERTISMLLPLIFNDNKQVKNVIANNLGDETTGVVSGPPGDGGIRIGDTNPITNNQEEECECGCEPDCNCVEGCECECCRDGGSGSGGSGGPGSGDEPDGGYFGDGENTISPLVLDLNSDGVKTTNINNGVFFDHNANGFKELTGWVDVNDGLLVLDRNSNGIIDSGRELFGDFEALKLAA